RMIDLLGHGGRLVFYGATSGYTLTFLGKPGIAPVTEMYARVGLRPHQGVLVYHGLTPTGPGDAPGDPRAEDAIETALAIGARAGQDTLGTSTFLARPFTGAVVFVEPSEGRRFSFYAPNVWMHGKRVLFPTFAVLGSHLSNAHQAQECARLVDAGALAVHSP